MNISYDGRPGNRQQIVIALEIMRPVGKPLAAIVIFAQLESLDHRAHRAIEQQDALVERLH